MTLALAAATEIEMRRALALVGAHVAVPRRGAVRARVAEREILALVTGVGPVSAALEAGAALAANPDVTGLVNLGLAGVFDLCTAPLGGVACATAEVWPEYGVAGEMGLADAKALGFAQYDGPEGAVWDRLPLAPDDAAGRMGLCLPVGWARGTFVTVGQVSGPDRAALLAERHQALAENMEGFSLALAAWSRGVAFLEVRTLSNEVGERDKSRWKAKAALGGLGQALAVLLGRA
ncbi:futalosine hydrolase [Fundidesulfovibrio butyratiphilus]